MPENSKEPDPSYFYPIRLSNLTELPKRVLKYTLILI